MRPSTLAVSVLVALGIPLARTEAQTSTERIGKRAEQAKETAKSVSQEDTADTRNAWLTAKTKLALFADERVRGGNFKVATDRGVVTLRGQVDSVAGKRAAAEIARGIEGINDVRNELQVVVFAGRAAVTAKDDDITREIRGRLGRDKQFSSAKVEVRSDGGVVTLTGDVPSIAESARASEIAREVAGVRSVRNTSTFPPSQLGTPRVRDRVWALAWLVWASARTRTLPAERTLTAP